MPSAAHAHCQAASLVHTRVLRLLMQTLLPVIREMGMPKGHLNQGSLETRLALIAAAPWKSTPGSLPTMLAMPLGAWLSTLSCQQSCSLYIHSLVNSDYIHQRQHPINQGHVCRVVFQCRQRSKGLQQGS